MNQPLNLNDLMSADGRRSAQAYAAHRRAAAAKHERKTSTQLRDEIDRAISDEEKNALQDAMDAVLLREREEAQRLAEFNQRTTLMMAGWRGGTQFQDLLEIKSHAMTNIATELHLSLSEAQQRIDDLLSSGLSKDFAEVVKWGNLHLAQEKEPAMDAAKGMDGTPVVNRDAGSDQAKGCVAEQVHDLCPAPKPKWAL
jgi:hypothetical protein